MSEQAAAPPASAKPAAPPKVRLTVRRPSEILALQFDGSDLILGDRLLVAGSNLVMVGPPGVGKSRLSVQVGICNQLGWPFLGLPTKPTPRPWLYIQTQNSQRRLQADLLAFRTWVGPERWEKFVANKLLFHTIETDQDAFLSLENPTNVRLMREMVGDYNPSVVTYDPLQDLCIGDLNRDQDMFASVSTLSQITRTNDPLRASFLLHHAQPGRLGAIKAIGMDRGAFGRNSKALLGWSRAVINIAPGSEDGRTIVVGCGKVSDGEEFKPFAACLNTATMTYEVDPDFDMNMWQADMSRAKPLAITEEGVKELLAQGDTKGKNRKQLADLIMATTCCSTATAYKAIGRAEKKKAIHYVSSLDIYTPSIR